MVIEKKFNSISELSALQHIASMADKEVYLASQDESIKVDARSFIGLFALSGVVAAETKKYFSNKENLK